MRELSDEEILICVKGVVGVEQ